jgi:hypothetical protein
VRGVELQTNGGGRLHLHVLAASNERWRSFACERTVKVLGVRSTLACARQYTRIVIGCMCFDTLKAASRSEQRKRCVQLNSLGAEAL